MRPKIVFVTDPMCSWCWGMASEIERARIDGADEFEFELLLGGINVQSTLPVTDFARSRLALVWRSVREVTDAQFGAGLPSGAFVYNSTRACVAMEAVRSLRGAPPFDYLLRLQRQFFVEGVDVTNVAVLRDEAAALGIEPDAFDAAMQSRWVRTRARDGFALAKSYGTAALPSVLLEVRSGVRLIAGGYVDAPTLLGAVREHVAN